MRAVGAVADFVIICDSERKSSYTDNSSFGDLVVSAYVNCVRAFSFDFVFGIN
jgi:hypothetical protein